MYFKARNGTFTRVQQFENGGLKQRGGMTVYYIAPYDGVSNVTAFKPVSNYNIIVLIRDSAQFISQKEA